MIARHPEKRLGSGVRDWELGEWDICIYIHLLDIFYLQTSTSLAARNSCRVPHIHFCVSIKPTHFSNMYFINHTHTPTHTHTHTRGLHTRGLNTRSLQACTHEACTHAACTYAACTHAACTHAACTHAACTHEAYRPAHESHAADYTESLPSFSCCLPTNPEVPGYRRSTVYIDYTQQPIHNS